MKALIIFSLLLVSVAYTQTKSEPMNVAVFIYDNVEILDFGGPSEVFAAAHANDEHAFNVYTFAATAEPVLSQGFIKITPEYTFENCPPPDIIVLPGGSTKTSLENEKFIQWLRERSKDTKIMMSVCTGAMMLAKAGLLDDKEATTWYGAIDRLKDAAPKTVVHSNTRFVDNGQIVTTAGVSAGIDGALHVVSRLLGEENAAAVAKYMEYDKWKPNEGLVLKD